MAAEIVLTEATREERLAAALRRANSRVREWAERRLDHDAVDIARVFRASRETLIERLHRVYLDHLQHEPTFMRARLGPGGMALSQSIDQTIQELTSELGQRAVASVAEMVRYQPTLLRSTLGRWFNFTDLPVTTQGVLGELTTSVVGGGTFFDRMFHMTDQLRSTVVGDVRQALLNGEDFDTLRDRLLKDFGVDKLRKPGRSAYGSVKVYKNEARRQWNLLMKRQARDTGAVQVWWATLDGRTSPGCAARHGTVIEGEAPPRHYNCRCTIAVFPGDEDLTEFRVEGTAWLRRHGWTRAQAALEEAWDPTDHPRDDQGRFGSGGGGAATIDDHKQMVADAGAIYNGIQKTPKRDYLVFTDAVTGSTMMVPVDDATPDVIKANVKRKRAEYKKAESIWWWGRDRLQPLFKVQEASDPDYRYASVLWRDLPRVVAGHRPVWLPTRESVVGAPDHVLLRTSTTGREVKTWRGWRPTAPQRGETWIETARGLVVDSPHLNIWDPEGWRLPPDLLARYPEMATVAFPKAPGEYVMRLVDRREAVAIAQGRLDPGTSWPVSDDPVELAHRVLDPSAPIADPYLVVGYATGVRIVVRTVVALTTGYVLFARERFPKGLLAPYTRVAVFCPEPDGRIWAIRPRGKHFWCLPGGHIDKGETPRQAAVREMREETGLFVTIHALLGRLHRPWSTTIVYEGRRVAQGEPRTPDEIDAVAAIHPSALLADEHAFLFRRGSILEAMAEHKKVGGKWVPTPGEKGGKPSARRPLIDPATDDTGVLRVKDLDDPAKYHDFMGRLRQPDGGFTYRPRTGAEPTVGYALSLYPERSTAIPVDKLTVGALKRYVAKHRDVLSQPGHHFGAWHDPKTGNVYLDVSMIVNDAARANTLALKHDQIAYFDLAGGKSVDVNRAATSGQRRRPERARRHGNVRPESEAKADGITFRTLPGDALDDAALLDLFKQLTGREPTPDEIDEIALDEHKKVNGKWVPTPGEKGGQPSDDKNKADDDDDGGDGGDAPAGDERRSLADYDTFEDDAERVAAMEELSGELDYPTRLISYTGEEGREFDVGGTTFREGGHAKLDGSGRIVLQKGAFAHGRNALRGLMAHEVQHQRYESVRKGYDAERDDIRANGWEATDKAGFLDPAYAGRYPITAALEPFLEGTDEWDPKAGKHVHKGGPDQFRADDGVSPYSTAYWTAWNKGERLPLGVHTAIHETLAEMERQRATTGTLPGSKFYRDYYKTVAKLYRQRPGLKRTSEAAVPTTIGDSIALGVDRDFTPVEFKDAAMVIVLSRDGVTFGINDTVRASLAEAGTWDPEKHPRGPGGKFGRGSGAKDPNVAAALKRKAEPTGMRVKANQPRAFTGEPVATRRKLGKLETGALGEQVAVEYLRTLGLKDARVISPAGRNNYPIDLVAGDTVFEVKAGLISNAQKSQQWRLTIGEPRGAEREKLAGLAADVKLRYNAKKSDRIFQRKALALAEVRNALGGKPLKVRTMTMILNPDTGQADVFMFRGFHKRIDWRSDEARAGYRTTVKFRGQFNHRRYETAAVIVWARPIEASLDDLTPEQRVYWTDDLRAGVPVDVILDFERRLDRQSSRYTRRLIKTFQRAKKL